MSEQSFVASEMAAPFRTLSPFRCVCGCDHGAHGCPGCKHEGCFGCNCPRFVAAKQTALNASAFLAERKENPNV